MSHDHTVTILPLVTQNPGFNPATDFVPVAGVASVPDFIENHKAGKLRIVAVLGGLEDLPYYGLFAPAGTPKAALERVADALAKAVAEPDVKKRLTDMGLSVGFATGAQLGEREKAYRASWTRTIHTSGFKPL